ncbi:MAG: aldehyde dehydrogenase family protein [Myxococcaceae bacterium]|nr:aldehyde dehydrogenase family protein [Myxococcaceae bacterium]
MSTLIENVCPVDLHKLPAVEATSPAGLKVAVALARGAQGEWAHKSFDARAKLLLAAAKQILARRQEVLELLHDEAGKTPGDVLMGEALGALQYVQDWVKVAKPHLKSRKLDMSPVAFPGKSGTIDLVPRGVVAIIAPWNFPLANFFKPVFAALLCGNTVVLKPSELSPRMGEWFTKVLTSVLPKNVLTVVQGGREVGQNLIKAGVDAVTFTGSTQSGREVAKACAEALVPVSLELGGKDCALVLADCNLERTVAGIMYWALANTGQSCGAIERVFVEDAIADRFIDKLATAVARLRITPESRTSDIGPLANARQLAVVEAHVKDAVQKGARVLCGGQRTGDGLFFQPTVLDRCTNAMLVMREPTFGPVIAVCRTGGGELGVQEANDCEYGLNASVWSQNFDRATKLARMFEVGTAYVNNHGFTGAMPAAPWTGVKKSGYGVANSTFALSHYTRPRTIVIDRNSGADAWWFPMDAALEELGHRLSEAQLGNVLAAAKVPLLLVQRQRAVLDFVKSGKRLERASKAAVSLRGTLARGITKALELGKRFNPPLTRKERSWGVAAMETIFTSDPRDKNRIDPVEPEIADAFLDDAYRNLPLTGQVGMRVSLAALAVLGPVIAKRQLKSFDELPADERLEVLQALWNSDLYLLRQVTLLMKTTGALTHATTTRLHRELSVTPNVPAPKNELRS